MFRRRGSRSGQAGLRSVGKGEFVDELIRRTRARKDCAYLYLMLLEGGTIGVQWEGPRGDQFRRYRIAGTGGDGCPHCAILAGIEALDPLLPLAALRAARARDQYLFLLRMGKLPCPAFAREPAPAGPFGRVPRHMSGWVADCHAGEGNPHTAADCARHRDP